MAPQPSEKMIVALRVLNAVMVHEEPDPGDVSKLQRWAPREELRLAPDDLARATVERELASTKQK